MTDTSSPADPTSNPADDGQNGGAGGGQPPDGQNGGQAGGGAGKGAKGGQPQGAKGGDTPFYDGWADDLKSSPVIAKYKSAEDLGRALVAAEKRLGVPADQLIRKPTKPEDMADVYRALGAPEDPAGYKIELPDGASDADKAMGEAFAKHMHAKGPFTHDAVAAAVEFWNEQTAQAAAAAEAEMEARAAEGEAALRKAWGADYERREKEVGAIMLELGGQDLVDELSASSIGDHPQLMLAFAKMADLRAENGALEGGGRGSGRGGLMTPAQAKAARMELENDPVKGKALRDKANPMHQAVVDERMRLFALEAGRDPASLPS